MPPQEQVNPSPPRVSFRGDNDLHQESQDPQPAFPPHTMTNPRQYRGINPPPQPKSRPRAPKATQRMVVKDPKAMPSAPAPNTNSSDFVAFPPTEITMSPKRNKNKQTSSSPNSNHQRPPRSPARSPPMQSSSGVAPLRADSPSRLRQTASVVQPSPPPMRQSASPPAAASSSPPAGQHSQNPAPAPQHQASPAPNSIPQKQDVTRDRRPHAPWRRRGQALRRKLIQEDGNAFELSHSCSIDRYYKVAERVSFFITMTFLLLLSEKWAVSHFSACVQFFVFFFPIIGHGSISIFTCPGAHPAHRIVPCRTSASELSQRCATSTPRAWASRLFTSPTKCQGASCRP